MLSEALKQTVEIPDNSPDSRYYSFYICIRIHTFHLAAKYCSRNQVDSQKIQFSLLHFLQSHSIYRAHYKVC